MITFLTIFCTVNFMILMSVLTSISLIVSRSKKYEELLKMHTRALIEHATRICETMDKQKKVEQDLEDEFLRRDEVN